MEVADVELLLMEIEPWWDAVVDLEFELVRLEGEDGE
eukprot:CAMPEP_0198269610 /NCGR_PEP_ID=MMETSP1447-20131203/41953_1 /TAXON_ID=420782 /ORGANISM="Chaetoceros dichaeta, Strain CCMP1751" /LENGTH=36 /DNA_ID=CAMNT_0043961261 /DNA_START=336 /DNA_END=443 /DNA_ORIENTATION=+